MAIGQIHNGPPQSRPHLDYINKLSPILPNPLFLFYLFIYLFYSHLLSILIPFIFYFHFFESNELFNLDQIDY